MLYEYEYLLRNVKNRTYFVTLTNAPYMLYEPRFVLRHFGHHGLRHPERRPRLRQPVALRHPRGLPHPQLGEGPHRHGVRPEQLRAGEQAVAREAEGLLAERVS